MVSHSKVVNNYFNASDREHYRQGSRVFFEQDTLYSYGHHFILAQKCKNGYILNGDRYSMSTARHQNETRQQAPTKSPIIPFSALEQILKTNYTGDTTEMAKITIYDVTEDKNIEYTAYNKDGEPYTAYRHILGASLIKYGRKFYLSGVDAGSKNFNSYFLVELPNAKTLCKKSPVLYQDGMNAEYAFRLLAGNLTDKQYKDYQEGKIKRQGEYFLRPCYKELHKILHIEKISKKRDLSRGRGNAHTARDMFKTSSGTYVRGTLRHDEHKMISLGEVWHKVIKNTAIRSFAASGNVD